MDGCLTDPKEFTFSRFSGCDFVHNFLGCCARVSGRKDGPSDYDKVRTRANRFPRRRSAGLIIFL
jgi:hypothetical protein